MGKKLYLKMNKPEPKGKKSKRREASQNPAPDAWFSQDILPHGTFQLDATGQKITSGDQQFFQYTQSRLADNLKTILLQKIPAAEKKQLTDKWKKLLTGKGRLSHKFRIPWGRGKGLRWLHCIIVPEKKSLGQKSGFQGILLDINESQQNEDALKTAVAYLEEMVSERTAQLKVANEKLSGEMQEKSFLEKSLIKSNQLLNSILDTTHMLVAFMDLKFNFIQVNLAYARADGKEPEFFPGKNHFELFPNQENKKIFRQVVKSGKLFFSHAKAFEYAKNPEQGTTYWDWSLIPMKEKGKVVGLVLTLADVSDRVQTQFSLEASEKALKQSETSLRAILNATNESILLINKDGTVITLNNIAAARFGKKLTEMTGRNIYDLLPPDDRKRQKSKIDSVFRTGQAVVFEDVRGEYFFENNVNPIFNGNKKVIQVAVFARDITREKYDAKEQANSREALRLSEEKYRGVTELVQSGIWQLDRGLNTVYVNPATARMLGYTEKEMLGKNLFNFCNPEKIEKYKKNLQRRKKGMTESTEVEYIHKNGKIIITQINASPIIDASGIFQGAIAGLMDVTERKENEDKLRKFLQAADTSVDPILMTDTKGFITYFNAAAEKLYGYAKGELLGIHISNLTGDPDFQQRVILPAIRDQGGWTGEVISRKKDGTLIPTLITTSMIKDEKGQALGMMGITRDIADRKKQEEILQKAKQVAEKANRAKSQFLANMSHDIRTPLNAIIGMTRLLLDTKLSDTQHGFLNTVLDSANSLLGLLNDILDFSKIEADQMVLTQVDFDLRYVIEETIQTLSFPAHEKGLELFYQYDELTEKKLTGDPLRLKQVLQNLLSNAIKFTSHGYVYLQVAEKILSDSQLSLHFSIEDTGIGINEKDWEKIFNNFIQLKNQDFHTPLGTGLGLAISRKLTALMGGKIWVESLEGRGSTFHFSAIFQISKDKKIREFSKNDFGEQKRILLISENDKERKAIGAMLPFPGIAIEEKSTGERIIEDITLAQESGKAFDLAIIDLKIIMKLQLNILKIIYQGGNEPRLPVILLFSAYDNTFKEFCGNHKHLYYLTKPLLYRNLHLVIKNALGKKEQPLFTAAMNPHTQEENKKNVAMDILVAEDNRYNQDLVRHILTKAGHLVTMAQNGREALEILSRKVFSLILMDIQMPEMDGITATGIIRQIEKGVQPKFALEYIALEAMKRLAVNLENRHIPILAMTAFAMAEDKNKTIAAGMDGYVTKPFNPDEILETIQSLGSGLGQVTAQISHHLNSENHSSPPPLEAPAVKKFLKESYHFSDEKIESMLLNLKTSLLEVFSRIEKSLTDKDAESLANALHNLKGVFYNIGSNDWAKLTQDAESRLRESEENNFEKLIKNLKRAVAQFIQ